MKNNGAVLLEVQLDTKKLGKEITFANNLGHIMEETSEALTDAASDLLGALDSVVLSFNDLTTSLTLVSTEMHDLTCALKNQASGAVSAMDIISNLLTAIALALEYDKFIEAFDKISKFLARAASAGSFGAGAGASAGASVGAGTGAAAGGLGAGPILAILAAVALTVAAVVKNFDAIKTRFNELWEEHIKPLWDRIMEFANSLATIWDTVIVPVAEWIYQVLGPIFTAAVFGVIEAVGVVLEVIGLVVTGIIDIVDGVIQAVAAVFEGDWDKLGENLLKSIWGVLEIIGGFFVLIGRTVEWLGQLLASAVMALIVGVVNLIGGILKVLGNIFGQDWGWHWEVATSLYIPKLAQGAVLPANKPFLAMVGDQRHGTNVEAPLATIQEAVAQVMENQFSGMMAGFEASVAVQKQILQAVLGIEVGDTVIGQAANRYNRRMAIIKGGM